MKVKETLEGYIISVPQEVLILNESYEKFMQLVRELESRTQYKLEWNEYEYNPKNFTYDVYLRKVIAQWS